jgi:hypothetical protein
VALVFFKETLFEESYPYFVKSACHPLLLVSLLQDMGIPTQLFRPDWDWFLDELQGSSVQDIGMDGLLRFGWELFFF